MDKLSQFVLDLYRSEPAPTTPGIAWVEPTAIEKRAYSRVFDGLGQDSDFLGKFEGTPLAPHAVALAERELAAEQRRLQRRMQRMAEDTWEQDSIEQDQIQLQKQQLLLQLYKMKAQTPAPQPGDATIGQPDPAQMQQMAPEADPQAPKMAESKQAELAKLSFTNPLAAGAALGAGVGAVGGGLAGARRGGPGHRMSGALRGAAAGGAVGAAGGAVMGHGMNLVGMADIMKMKDPVMQVTAARAAGAGMTGGQKALVYGGLGTAGVGGLAAGHMAGGTAKQSAMAVRRREQLGSEIGGGDIGSFPVHEPTPKLSALPHINNVLHTPRATRGSVPSEDHLLEMGGNPYLPHHARKAILDAYLQERAGGSTASADEVMQGHLEAGRAGNQAGGALAGGFLVGPLLGAGLGGLAAHHLKHDIGLGASLGAVAGMPLGALAGGYLGGKRSVTPMTEAEAQRHIDKANLHREMYPQLMKDDAAKEHLLHQLSARHYENALDEARQQAEEDYYDRQHRYGRGKYSSEEDDEPSYRRRSYATKTADAETLKLMGLGGLIGGALGATTGAAAADPDHRLRGAGMGALGGAAGGAAGAGLLGLAFSNRFSIPSVDELGQQVFSHDGTAETDFTPAGMLLGAAAPAVSVLGVPALAAYASRRAMPKKTDVSAKTAAIHSFAQALRKTANVHPAMGAAVQYGLPGMAGALHGAEGVPENRMVGALGGATGAVAGSELGGAFGRQIHNSLLGDIIGRVIGVAVGREVGTQGARFAVT